LQFAIRNKAKHFYLMMPQTPFTDTVFKGIRAQCEPKGIAARASDRQAREMN